MQAVCGGSEKPKEKLKLPENVFVLDAEDVILFTGKIAADF